MISLLQAMPDAVHFEYSNKDGDYKLHGVGDSKSFFMPSWILKTQGGREEGGGWGREAVESEGGGE